MAATSQPAQESAGLDGGILEPIAVVGMSMKFPQDAVTEESFWQMLLEKRCAATEFPEDRLNIGTFHSSEPGKRNTISTRKAHFLGEDFRAFDAPFFSIPPLEAATIDPQQRGLLEATYRALENAGIPMEAVRGSDASVHVGSFTSDFKTMVWRDAQQIPKYSATGTAGSILSNRISWFFDLGGPSMTVDTACSSGLVALDLSCNGLWSGQSRMGVVAGSNLILSPELNIALSSMSFLSKDGQCFSFDQRGNGYGRGEGFGVLILKRLSDAIQDGDTIRALIRSTGVNQDGNTPGGVTQPSRVSQAALITDTYRKAGLGMGLTRFFEAHGTGTAIGDPIEARAIGDSFRDQRPENDKLLIGAVKANLGHLEGASGLAGLIKTILVLEKGLIPPNASFENLNSNIDAEFLQLEFPLECTPWPSNGPRRASVNSFGFGGTNAHAVLEDVRSYLLARNLVANHCTVESALTQRHHTLTNSVNPDQLVPKLLVFSSADEAGMRRLSQAYSQYFAEFGQNDDAQRLLDLAFTLNSRRSALPWKSYIVASSTSELAEMEQLVSKPLQASGQKTNLGFVFTGQGAQWYAMGRELMLYPVFKDSLLRAQACLQKLGCSWLLTVELSRDKSTSRINEPEFSQALCTAVQLALVDLFQSAGVVPAVVVGHSSGEISAAYCNGSLSMESAMKISYRRGALASKLARSAKSKHRMASIGLSQAQFTTELEKLKQEGLELDSLTISCINSPKNVTVSGPDAQLDVLVAHYDKTDVFARKLMVDVGYHSPQMQEIAGEYLAAMDNLTRGIRKTKTIMVSSVTGAIIDADVLCTGEYWVQNMVSPVNFLGAMKECCSRPGSTSPTKKLDRSHLREIVTHALVEIGPHSALQGPIRDILSSVNRGGEVSYASALVRNRSAVESLLATAGRLHCQGISLDVNALNLLESKESIVPRVLVDLPHYPFNHSTVYWEESQMNKEFRFREHLNHELLGNQAPGHNELEPRWRLIIRSDELPWVEDHKVNGSILYPAAGMLAMAIEATKQLTGNDPPLGYEIKDAVFHSPLLISTSKENVETQICLRPSATSSNSKSTWYDYRMYVHKTDEDWTELCTGSIRADYGRTQSEVDHGVEGLMFLDTLRTSHSGAANRCNGSIESSNLYRMLKEMGLEYGPAFQPLHDIRYSQDGEATARVALFNSENPAATEAQSHVIHPTTLDGIFQMIFVALSKGSAAGVQTMVPSRIDKVWVSNTGAGTPFKGSLEAYTKSHQFSKRSARGLVSVLDNQGQLMVHVDGFEATAVSTQTNTDTQEEARQLCYNMTWKWDPETMDASQIQKYCKTLTRPDLQYSERYKDAKFMALAFGSAALRKLRLQNRVPCLSLRDYAVWLQMALDDDLAPLPVKEAAKRRAQIEDPTYLGYVCKHLASSSLGQLFMRIGHHLANILSGDVDPLDVLFSDEYMFDEFHRELTEGSGCFVALGKYLEALAHKNPGMEILEIGAGTGATTAIVQEILASQPSAPSYGQYDFTDSRPFFVDRAREKFQPYSRMAYHVLDLEKDIVNQGLKEGSYDVVVATSALVSYKDSGETIRNAQKLLRPGGKLILGQITVGDAVRPGFANGLLPGWWSKSPETPCVSEEKWDEILKENGFSGTDIIFRDFEDEQFHDYSIIVSTAKPVAPVRSFPREIVAIVESNSESQRVMSQYLGQELRKFGYNLSKILTLEQAASLLDQNTHHYIVMHDLSAPLLRNLTSEGLSALQTILSSAGSLLWVMPGGRQGPVTPACGMVEGLCRVSRQENPNIPLVTLALDVFPRTRTDNFARNIARVFHLTVSHKEAGDFEPEYVEMDDCLHINRLSTAASLNDHIYVRTNYPRREQKFGDLPAVKVDVRTPGLLDSLEFIEDEKASLPLGPNEVEIEVRAIGVNFKECLTVLGRVNTDTLGNECSGVVSRVGDNWDTLKPGDRVALCATDTYRSFARSSIGCAAKIPDGMTFNEAAAIPTAFCTAYYCLVESARLEKGESILIHAASGGTGQAAVQIALHLGAEVFATVGSREKKQLIMSQYQIPEDHIFYSRDLSFADGIKRMTQGRGVDVVLNSLAGDQLVATWECIAPYGRFMEIGRRDIDNHGNLPMYSFLRNASFTGVDLAAIVQQRPQLIQKMMREIMRLVEAKKLGPAYPLTVFPISDMEHAFRTLQSGKSSGKIVLEATTDAIVPTSLKTRPSYNLSKDATYLIAGGLGGIGRSIAKWLVDRGANNLILLSRSGPDKNDKGQALVAELRAKGVRVVAPACDITSLSALKSLVQRCAKTMPPIKGCIQASMVLRDTTFPSMSFQQWEESVRPKVQGSWNLHVSLPQGMDFFVLLSSASGIFGNPGQSNYAAGNTYQDELAHYRVLHGEKAVALDLGVVLSEGVVAENSQLMDRLMRQGVMLPITQEEVQSLLDFYCNPALQLSPQWCDQVILGIDIPAKVVARGGEVPVALCQPLFRKMHQIEFSGQSSVRKDENSTDFKTMFASVGTLAEAGMMVSEALRKKLSKVLGIAEENIELSHRVESYGVDSLVAVELRNWVSKEMSADLAVFEIVGGATLVGVGLTAASKSAFKQSTWT
ncbi:Highly reducing polyketide synthase [Lachnellula willkommii]|uniref:Highly reducing polyketide synthase n=1 Tax=Lachnellula willkommii TaxID=215461 RepID=A0A559ME65_9HELO|nr:Highly reducing polyketide synthase [Lachnellula willkommii]